MVLFGPPARAQVPPCAVAATLLDARLLDDAFKAYTGTEGCLPTTATLADITRLRTEHDSDLVAGDRAKAAGDIPGARGSYEAALQADAGSAKARERLAAVDGDPFAPAQALLDGGFRDKAREELGKVLATGARLPDGKHDELRKLIVEEKARSWVGVALFVLGLAIVAFVLANMTVFDLIRRSRLRVKAGRARWRRYFRPRLAVVAGDGDDAAVFATEIQALMVRSDRDNGEEQLQLAGYPETALDLSAVADIDARLKIVGAAAKLLGARDTVTARASIAGEDKACRRATLQLGAPMTDSRAISVRQSTEGVDAPTPAVVGQMVGWLLMNADAMRRRLRPHPKATRDVYGTEDIDSFSAYLGGVEAFRAGDLVTARRLFSAALDSDAGNARAVQNLALTHLLDSSPTLQRVGVERLERLLA